MELDYLNTELFNKVCIKNWTRAVIKEIDQNKQLLIKLKGQESQKIVSIRSVNILPVNTLSSDFDFRESLQKGQEIDILDAFTWTPSTVIDTSTDLYNNRVIKFGLRLYRNDGKNYDRTDSRKYFGWSESFDMYLSVHNPRIRQ